MPMRIPPSRYFEVKACTSKGIEHHLWARPLNSVGHIGDIQVIAELREKLVPYYMMEANIHSLVSKGFRLVIDYPSPNKPAEVHLISGKGTGHVSPPDWLTARVDAWDPSARADFYSMCSQAARSRLNKVLSGNRMFYPSDQNDIFAVENGDPKADSHWLMFSIYDHFRTMADPHFTADLWRKYFLGAQAILKSLGIDGRPARYTVNFGLGAMPRPHLHILSYSGDMLSPFPSDHGFIAQDNGTIVAPKGSDIHAKVIALIKERGNISGSSSEAKAEKKKLDEMIFNYLKLIGTMRAGK